MTENKKINSKDKRKEFQQKVADNFLKLLDPNSPENSAIFKNSWQSISNLPQSMSTGKQYRGINLVNLYFVALAQEYKDPRWATFNQIKAMGGTVKKGEKASQIQYNFFRLSKKGQDLLKEDVGKVKLITAKDYKTGKEKIKETYTGAEKRQLEKLYPELNGYPMENYLYYQTTTYLVFNADQCDGIKPLEVVERNINENELVTTIADNMGVQIYHEGNESYYSRLTDSITLPKKEVFFSDYGYNATALHELSHASGAKKRLNRTVKGRFGDENYAFEELVAEISSAIASTNLIPNSEEDFEKYKKEHMESHLAYVKDWYSVVKEHPDVLEKAIEEATLASDYLELNGNLMTVEEFNRIHTRECKCEIEDGKIITHAIRTELSLQESLKEVAEQAQEVSGEITPSNVTSLNEVTEEQEIHNRLHM